MSELTAEIVRSLLDYNPATGVFTWRVKAGSRMPGTVAGSPDSLGYIKIAIRKKDYRAHRLAWLYVYGEWPADMVDHIDGNPGNNAFRNLRAADNVLNQQNQRRAKKSNRHGFMGASRLGEKWKAGIMVRAVWHYLGVFDTAQEAHEAYMEAKRRLHPGCTI